MADDDAPIMPGRSEFSADEEKAMRTGSLRGNWANWRSSNRVEDKRDQGVLGLAGDVLKEKGKENLQGLKGLVEHPFSRGPQMPDKTDDPLAASAGYNDIK